MNVKIANIETKERYESDSNSQDEIIPDSLLVRLIFWNKNNTYEIYMNYQNEIKLILHKMKKAVLARNEVLISDLFFELDDIPEIDSVARLIEIKLLTNILCQKWNDSSIIFNSLYFLKQATDSLGSYKLIILDSLIDFNGIGEFPDLSAFGNNTTNFFVSRNLLLLFNEFAHSDLPILEHKFNNIKHELSLIDLAALIYIVGHDEYYLNFVQQKQHSDNECETNYAKECLDIIRMSNYEGPLKDISDLFRAIFKGDLAEVNNLIKNGADLALRYSGSDYNNVDAIDFAMLMNRKNIAYEIASHLYHGDWKKIKNRLS